MFVALALAMLAALFVVSVTDNQPATRRAPRTRTRLSDSPAQRRERAELAYIDDYSAERLDDALAEIRRLVPLVEAAQGDADLTVRFFQLDNELGDAIMAYERAVDRRGNFCAIAA